MGTKKNAGAGKTESEVREVPPHSRTLTAEGWRRKREKQAEDEKGAEKKKKKKGTEDA